MEETLIKEAIETLKNKKRPELLNVTVYGRYSAEEKTFLYNDCDKKYVEKTNTPCSTVVRSVKAFANLIKEELQRRNNPTGNKSTVSINLDGGVFSPDDNFGETTFKFHRLNSQQWEVIRGAINQTMSHKQFLLFLQSIKPSIPNFQEFFKSFAILRLVGKSKLTSNPIITENGQEESYTCTYKLEDGTDGEERFPTGFPVRVPFAKAGDKLYTFDIELLLSRNEYDQISITVLCPLFENVEEDAIIDEAEYIKAETKEFEELLVLSDF